MVWLGGPNRRTGRAQPIVLHDPPPGPHARTREVERARLRKAAKHDPHVAHTRLSQEEMRRSARKAAARRAMAGQASSTMMVIMGLAVLVVAGLVIGLAITLH